MLFFLSNVIPSVFAISIYVVWLRTEVDAPLKVEDPSRCNNYGRSNCSTTMGKTIRGVNICMRPQYTKPTVLGRYVVYFIRQYDSCINIDVSTNILQSVQLSHIKY